ncbi:MAG: glycosyltransferase [Candidatus Moranbacteria bacterium]|jgi:glycosyltransferase involved in cell wall biosynthesis|nr:glycosyltransferase [Candidatus Moranbacteria bacterium]
MKILEINKFYFPKGGADKHFLDVVSLLESAGHEVAVFSMKHPKNKKSKWEKYFVSLVGYTADYSWAQRIKGIFRMFYSFEAKRKINKLLDDFRPDVAHIHNVYHQLSPMILFEIKKRGIPIVMTVHDYKLVSPNYDLYHNGKIYNRCRDGKYYQCFLDKCFKNSYAQSLGAMLEAYWHDFWGTYQKNIDLYICPSEFVKNILVDRGIDEGKIKIVFHFIFPDSILDEDIESGLQEKYAIYCGRISRNKGVENLISVFGEVSGMKLYLAGEIEGNFVLSKSERIVHLGFLNQIMLKKYIREAIVVVSGSELPETFGLVALEAVSQEKPFIGFKAGAYGEIIQNGKNGFIVNSQKEMIDILNKIVSGEIVFDKEKIGREALEKYSKDKYVSQFENILYNLVKGRN